MKRFKIFKIKESIDLCIYVCTLNIFQLLRLFLKDAAKSLAVIEEDDQSFSKYLHKSIDYIYGLRECPVPSMTLCVTSDPELEKCVKMRVNIMKHNPIQKIFNKALCSDRFEGTHFETRVDL